MKVKGNGPERIEQAQSETVNRLTYSHVAKLSAKRVSDSKLIEVNSAIDIIETNNRAIDEKLGALAYLIKEIEELRSINWTELQEIKETLE